MPNDNMDRPFGWDDEVEVSTSEFTVLPEGDYDFTVASFERGYTQGSEKMSSSPMANLSLRCTGPGGSGTVRTNLILNDRTKWKVCEFFKATGLIDASASAEDRVRFPWSRVVGASGRCHLSVRKWRGNDGAERESNDVARFMPRASGMSAASLPKSF